MKLHKVFVALGLCLIVTLTSYLQANAQPNINAKNVEATVYVLESNGEGKQLSRELESLAKDIRSDFHLTDLKLASTYFGRTNENGQFAYSGFQDLKSLDGQMPDGVKHTKWSIGFFDKADGNLMILRQFNYSIAFPIKDHSGLTNINELKINAVNISMIDNMPTLMGSMVLPGKDKMQFIVLRLKMAKN